MVIKTHSTLPQIQDWSLTIRLFSVQFSWFFSSILPFTLCRIELISSHTHTHIYIYIYHVKYTYIYIYIYIYIYSLWPWVSCFTDSSDWTIKAKNRLCKVAHQMYHHVLERIYACIASPKVVVGPSCDLAMKKLTNIKHRLSSLTQKFIRYYTF